ncbi:MAG: hypothetical protein A2189_02620 [Paenibacillus sp. RIFOXYA1_FULL_44_5]|nr:MAG: hypothetical protein A2189_02620 [Paenibacillus sp. RIFOXYA1_FULL_44_5]
MDDSGSQPKPGQFVQILKGRDAGQFAVIVQIVDPKYVLIVDGDKKKFDKPKRKNLIHLRLMDVFSSEVADSLKDSGRVTNSKIRFVIQKYMEHRQTDSQEKGE